MLGRISIGRHSGDFRHQDMPFRNVPHYECFACHYYFIRGRYSLRTFRASKVAVAKRLDPQCVGTCVFCNLF
uniref:Uncharacterized protein n=1 Tax=Pararge aegeria TaxID=116150 RepID=S4PXS0_9NEOP